MRFQDTASARVAIHCPRHEAIKAYPQHMGHLGQSGFHPFPLTRRQNDYADLVHHVVMWATNLRL